MTNTENEFVMGISRSSRNHVRMPPLLYLYDYEKRSVPINKRPRLRVPRKSMTHTSLCCCPTCQHNK